MAEGTWEEGGKRGQLNGVINMWGYLETFMPLALPASSQRSTSGVVQRIHNTFNHVGRRANDQGHDHILHFCQYLRVQYLSNIRQVTDDSSLRLGNDGCRLHMPSPCGYFCGGAGEEGGTPRGYNSMRRQWRRIKRNTVKTESEHQRLTVLCTPTKRVQ